MSVEMTPDGPIYDPWDYDETRPKKYGPENAKRWHGVDLDKARDELFANGSDFLRTYRSDIIGIENVLIEIDDVIHWLKHSKEYQAHNSRLEPGVIFEGDPGTGKTLVSRYIATESNALFINVRDFPHQGSLYRDADIRDLFARARAKYEETSRPILLFWDEFENGACERASATPEQVATVSQLTAELDGVHGKNEGVLLIGCTNYIYGIDAALKRSGRMGLQIEFATPDRNGKNLLLAHYLRNYRTDDDIDVPTLSYFFDSDATAADIEEACVEAWRYAVRRAINNGTDPVLAQEDLVEVFIKRLVGPPTSFVNMPLEDRVHVAVHEVGHAIMAVVYEIPMRLITVKPGKKSLGRVIVADMRDHIGTIDEMVSQMRVGIGSIVAERVAGLPAMVGSAGDVKTVNQIATRLVDNLYAGERSSLYSAAAVGAIRTPREGGATPNVSANLIQNADDDVMDLLNTTYEDATMVMQNIGSDRIWEIANEVNERGTLTGQEFIELFERVCEDPAPSFR